MRKLTLGAFAALAFASADLGMPLNRAFADNSPAGIVRVSDKQQPIPESGALPKPGERGASAVTVHEHNPSQRQSRPNPVKIMIGYSEGNTYSPDHGWGRPLTYPIHRIPVEYHRYWPQAWYGEPNGGIHPNALRFPVVYMPTDTTQLGFYYQRVPQWRPNPYMIPPVPWPPQWHHREVRRTDLQPRFSPVDNAVGTPTPVSDLGTSSKTIEGDKSVPPNPAPNNSPKP